MRPVSAALALVLGCAPIAHAADVPSRPNLLLVTLDTTRADRLASWGRRDGLTPGLDLLAATGVVFADCVAPTGTTKPSHASMFTGLYPRSHGVVSNLSAVPDAAVTVAELLRDAGYRTGAFVSFGPLLGEGGLGQGFEHRRGGADEKEVQRGDVTTQAAIRWLRAIHREAGKQGVERPFFAWVHYFDAHSPYQATPWARRRLRGYTGEYARRVEVGRFGLGRWMNRPEDVRAVRTLYDGGVRASDTYLARLLQFLRAKGLDSKTVVIATADHGQALGEHDFPGHGVLWESILHVPLVVRDGRAPRVARVEERVGLVDLAPTLLDLAGVQAPAALHGRSLVPALTGEPLTARPYFGSVRKREPHSPKSRTAAALREDASSRIGAFAYESAVYEGPLKLMTGPDASVLFDVRRDPGELSPLPRSQHRESYERLESLLEAFQTTTAATPEAPEVPDSVREQLRALGYAD